MSVGKKARQHATIKVGLDQHDRYHRLKARTGLHPRVFLDRVLDLAEADLQQLIALRPEAGIRAAS